MIDGYKIINNFRRKGGSGNLIKSVFLISIVILSGCSKDASREDFEDRQRVRIASIEKLPLNRNIRFAGKVDRVDGKLHRIMLKDKPCKFGHPEYRIVVPTMDREMISANLIETKSITYLRFYYPPLLLDELKVTVEMRGCKDPHWVVPIQAIWNPTGKDTSLFVVRDERVKRVETGEPESFYKGKIVLFSHKLNAEDRIVIEGLEGLVDGERVEVVP